MLIRFAVENYRSFKERQIFSMAAGKQTRFQNHLMNINDHRLLKSSIMFGANASGKSNFIHAIDCMRRLVLSGDAGQSRLQDIYFRIDPSYRGKPGIFQMEFLVDKDIYSYGFSVNYQEGRFEAEWLYLTYGDKETCIFERDISKKKDDDHGFRTDLKFPKNSRDANRFNVYSADIADNHLFLTEMAKKDIDEKSLLKHLKLAYQWFSNIIVIYPESHALINNIFFPNNNSNTFLEQMLCDLDTGIENLDFPEKTLDEAISFLPDMIQQEFKNDLDHNENIKNSLLQGHDVMVRLNKKHLTLSWKNGIIFAKEIMSNHGNAKDLFELSDESDGTKRLFDLIPAYDLLRDGKIVLIDEFDRSFHSKMTEEYIKRYFEYTKGAPSQLVCTTHDLNLLSLKLFRQDEIWFIERNADHSSHMYSLSEFKTRFDKDLLKDYLLGRYGAMPCFIESYNEEL